MSTILEARNLSKSFAATQALQDVSFTLESGEIHAIVGENGAGKSTFVKILSGLVRPDQGQVRFMGEPVVLARPADADALGISVIHQELSLVPDLSVAKNLALGQAPTREGVLGRVLGAVAHGALMRQAEEALALIGADIPCDRSASSLSASEIQLVLIARALHRKMKLLILDEPTSALSPNERVELFQRLRVLRESQVGIIYISHHLDDVLGLADRISVFRNGTRVRTMAAAAVSVEEVIELMLARSLREMYPKVPCDIGEPALEVEGLVTPTSPRGVDFVVRRGEIVGLTGIVGAGKTEIARAIIGAGPGSARSLRVGGQAVRIRTPAKAVAAGIVLVPENRATEGLIHQLSVRDNIAVQIMSHPTTRRRLMRGPLINWQGVTNVVRDLVTQLGIRTHDPSQLVSSLSGGNQQKVVLARAFATNPAVVILDEPTRGVDVGSKVDVYAAIEALASDGAAVLMISSEFDEIVGICDRVLIMRRGEIVKAYDRGEVSRELVLRHAITATEEGVNGRV
jgi:ABC-type sugar transport system ATPase subunit